MIDKPSDILIRLKKQPSGAKRGNLQ